LKGLETPWGDPAIWSLPDVERLVWLRLPGDIVAGAAIVVFLALLCDPLPASLGGFTPPPSGKTDKPLGEA